MLQKISLVASNLFFMMLDDSNYWKTLENSGEEEAREILQESAKRFCKLMQYYEEGLEPDDVVEDFLKRL